MASPDFTPVSKMKYSNRNGQPIPSRAKPLESMTSQALSMTALLVVGVAFAIGHDLIYNALDGKIVDASDVTFTNIGNILLNQTWSNRIGNALALGFKLGLSGAIALAFSARLWNTVQSKAISTKGLDAMFSAIDDPLAYINMDFWSSAFVLLIIGALSWLTPLATIFTPGTLTVAPSTSISNSTCSITSGNLPNTTFPAALTEGAGFYSSPTSATKSLTTRCLVTGTFVPWDSPCGSATCSYRTALLAPAYQCTPHDGKSGPEPNGGPTSPVIKWRANTTLIDGVEELGILWESGNLTCTPYNATYNLEVLHNGTQSIKVVDMVYHNVMRKGDLARPFIDINNTGIYNFAALVDSLNDALVGTIQLVFPASSNPRLDVTSTSVVNSNFAAINGTTSDLPNLDVGDVRVGVEGLLANMSIGMMALAENDPLQQSTCGIIASTNIYVYDRQTLWLAYGAAIVVTLLCLAVGVHSLIINGGGHTQAFSYFVQTTRSPELDRLAAEDEVKRQSGVEADTLARARLRYAYVDSEYPNGVTWAFTPEGVRYSTPTY